MKKAFIAIAAIFAVAASCTKEEFKSAISFSSGEAGGPVKTVNGQISAGTKAGLDYDAGQQFWTEADSIAIFARVKDPIKQEQTDTMKCAKFVLVDGAGTAKGTFESETGIDEIDRYYAVYPYNEDFVAKMGKTADEDEIHVEFKPKQNYDENTLMAEGNNLMVSVGSSTDFYFKNICSYVGLMISGPSDDQIQSIVFRSLDGAVINGEAVVKFKEGEPSVEFTGDGNDASIISFYDYDNGIQGVDFWNDTEVDIAVPPVMNGGFSVTVVTANGLEMTKTSTTPLGISQKTVMPLFDFDAAPASAEIDGVQYPSFKAALKAANEAGADCTIKLIRDCHIAGIAEVSNTNAVIKLDLNGKKLSAIGDNRINVLMDCDLVIEDNSTEQTGVIEQVNSGSNAVLSYGHLTVNSGTIIGGLAAIYVYNGVLEVNGGTFMGDATSNGVITVNSSSDPQFVVDSAVFRGGLVKASARGMYFKGGCSNVVLYDGLKVDAGKVPVYNTDCHIIINGGQYITVTTNPVLDRTENSPGIEIYGGYFYTGGSAAIVYGRENQTKVYGGYFARNVSTSYVAEGFQCQGTKVEYDGRTYLYEVVKPASLQATLQVDNGEIQNFANVASAFAECLKHNKNTNLITLQASCTMGSIEGSSFTLPNDFTGTVILDLNGYTLGANGKNKRINIDGGTFIIRSTGDNAANGTLACLPADSYSLYQTGGKLKIEGGRFTGAPNNEYYSVYVKSGESVEITGGEFYNDYYQSLRIGHSDTPTRSIEVSIKNAKFYSEGHTKNGVDTINQALYLTTGVNVAYLENVEADGICSYGGSGAVIKNSAIKRITKTNTGEMTVESGTYQNCTIDAHGENSVINITGGIFADGVKVIGDGNVNILNGSFTAGSMAALVADGGTANINGGEFTASNNSGTVRAQAGGKVVVNDGKIEATASESSTVRALYAGDPNDNTSAGTINLNGGKVISAAQGVHLYSGDFAMTDGSIKAAGRLVCGNKGKTTMQITGGYLATDYTEDDVFTSEALYRSITGGYFTRTFDANFLDPAMILQNITPVEYDGITYNYQVVENHDAPDVIKVNGVGYKTLETGFAAAKNSEVDAEIQLIQDIDLKDNNNDFTNVNGKQITIDINGYVLSSDRRNAILTEGILNIKDGSAGHTGKLVAGRNRFVYVKTKGTVNITDCLLESMATNRYTATDSSVILVHGSSSERNGAITISNCTFKTMGDNGCSFIGSTYGTVTIKNSTLINKVGDDKGYYCIKTTTGATTLIKDSKLISMGSPILIQGSGGNAAFSIENSYFYGGGKAITSTSGNTYDQCLTVTSGWFNSDIRNNLLNWKVAEGREWVTLSPKVTTTVDGVDYEFGYAVVAKN